jgi:hypothetical protein
MQSCGSGVQPNAPGEDGKIPDCTLFKNEKKFLIVEAKKISDMKNYFLLFIFYILSQLVFGQQESIGEFTYYESVDGQKTINTAMPYITGGCSMTVELKSGYGFTMNINKRDSILFLLESCQKSTINKKTNIGNIGPVLVFKKLESSDSSVLAPMKMSFYYDGEKITISFPKLYSELNKLLGKPYEATGHAFYISKDNLVDFINCFKDD